MRHPVRFLIAAGAAMLLALATPASARHPVFSVSIFTYPQRAHMDRVQVLAHELENATAQVSADAIDQSHHFDWQEGRAIRRLRGLNAAAAQFHNQVESYDQDPRQTAGAFRILVGAYNRAADAMDNLHPRAGVEAEFDQVASLMSELTGYYQQRYQGRGYSGAWSTSGWRR